MIGDVGIAFAAAFMIGYLIWRQMSKRATANDFTKTIAPPLIAGALTFMIVLTILKIVF